MFEISNDLNNMLLEVFKFIPIALPAVLTYVGVMKAVRYIINSVKGA